MATGGRSSDILMVAAIDFGTTYSGYAYSMKGEYERDKLNIHANTAWNSGTSTVMSLKAPTCILLRKETKELVAFGYDAENEYADIASTGRVDDYYYFERFKMVLYTREVIFTIKKVVKLIMHVKLYSWIGA